MAAGGVVEAFHPLEDRPGEPGAGWPVVPVEELALKLAKKLSATALSSASPTVPIEPISPAARRRCPNTQEQNWADSIGGSNTGLLERA